jgi:hypothetical protein
MRSMKLERMTPAVARNCASRVELKAFYFWQPMRSSAATVGNVRTYMFCAEATNVSRRRCHFTNPQSLASLLLLSIQAL